MKKLLSCTLCALLSLGLFSFAGCGTKRPFQEYEDLLANSPSITTVTAWTYYDNMQKSIFDKFVKEFNEGFGREKRIFVEANHLQNINGLYQEVVKAAKNEVGTKPMPNMFMIYADNCLELDTTYHCVAPMDNYFTAEELSVFASSALNEGRFDEAKSLKILPIAKSTEMFMMNKTEWDKFAAADPTVSLDNLKTYEGIAETAEKFYRYTGGTKALFGRDAMANYFITGAKSLGTELFTVNGNEVTPNFDKTVFKKMYDAFYVPYVKGHYAASGRFRTDDIKNEKIIACVGSTAGATAFPTSIDVGQDPSNNQPIDVYVAENPVFKGGKKVTIQQGAGVAIAKKTAKEEYASAVFLKWFNDKTRAAQFSANTGYIPAVKDALDISIIAPYIEVNPAVMRPAIETTINMTNTYEFYYLPPFKNSYEVRSYLDKIVQGNDGDANLTNGDEMKQIISNATAAGMSLETAYSTYLNSAAFDAWYNAIISKVQSLLI